MANASVFALLSIIATFIAAVTAQSQNPLLSLPLRLINDDSFNFQLINMLGFIRYQGADAVEVLAAANVIEPGSFYSFNSTFATLAENSHALADSASKSSSPVNNRDLYFAAASYYRFADFYLHGDWNEPLINTYWNQQTICFNNAIAALPVPGIRISVPGDNFTAIGIFYGVSPPNSTIKSPTLILGSGYDGAQEDSFHTNGLAALERGWNVITYEGPGQPTVRRDQNLGFIPDWEKVVTPIVDYLATRSDVDMSRLVLMGASMGGYLALRGAAFEPRIKAAILNDGVWDFHQTTLNQLGPQLTALYLSGNKTAFDAIINGKLANHSSGSLTSGGRWALEQGLWSFNTHSPYDWINKTTPYEVASFIDQVKIPVWVGNAANDEFFPNEGVQVANALGSRATLHNFTGPESYHCEVGGNDIVNQAIFAWLGQVFPN